MRLLTIGQFCEASGFSERQVLSYIKRGVWRAGRGAARDRAVLRVIDGRTYISEAGFDAWVDSGYRRAASRAAWRKANSGKVVAYTRARQAAQLQRTPSWANQSAIAAIYEEAAKVSRETGKKHHVDHIIPLRGKTVCGLHVESNLRIIPASENLRRPRVFRPECS